MLFLLIAFASGVLTVLAPCTISLLPVIVGGTASGGSSMRRAFTVTASLGVSVLVFTLALKASTALINIPQSFWQGLSGTIIVFLGLAMLFPALWEKIPFLGSINRSSNKLVATGYQKQNIIGDILIGGALGPVFSACSPTYFLILATVLPKSTSEGLIYLIAYIIGLCGTLLIIARAGQKLMEKFGAASDPKSLVKRGVALLFLVLGVVIFFGYDKKLELFVAEHIFDITAVERSLLSISGPVTSAAPVVAPTTSENIQTESTSTTVVASTTKSSNLGTIPSVYSDERFAMRKAHKKSSYSHVPEIANPSGFINTGGSPITIKQYVGKKVVLIDFWTYSCINCQRTLPYLKAWYDKYHDQGLEIVSIHTPEFAFEHVLGNVQKYVTDNGIKYPVVLDNDYGTWNAFGNQFWPRKYLVDIDGFIIYDHAGEGSYDETEKMIQKALAERTEVLGMKDAVSKGIVAPKDVITVDGRVGSSETYFGSSRNEYFGNGKVGVTGIQTLTLPGTFDANKFYLDGVWTFTPESASSAAGSKIVYRYSAKDVYFVASSAQGAKLTILVDGVPVTARGADVAEGGSVTVKDNRLYKLVHGLDYGTHTLQIRIESGTLEAYTFTFG